jgi:predicted amidohydrolase
MLRRLLFSLPHTRSVCPLSTRLLSSSAFKMADSSPVELSQKCLLAVCQLTCANDKQKNFEQASSIVREAAQVGCRLIFLPECFDMVCDSRALTLQQAEPLDGPLVSQYRDLAKQLKVHLFLGGMHEQNSNDPSGKCSNAHIAIDSEGQIVSVYRKLHLFNLDVPGTRLVESDFSNAGDRVQTPIATPAGNTAHFA